MESAPFVRTYRSSSEPPFMSLTMTLILFLVLVNSRIFSSLYFFCYPRKLIVITLSSSLFKNSAPKNLAALTSANSSGEEALYLPVLSSRMIEWHSAMCVMNFSMFSLFSWVLSCKCSHSLESSKLTLSSLWRFDD
jgi:hypothetical protein